MGEAAASRGCGYREGGVAINHEDDEEDLENYNDYGCSNKDQSYCRSLPQFGGVMGEEMITVSVALESVVTVVDIVISLALKNVRGINCANQVDISSQIMCLASMCK